MTMRILTADHEYCIQHTSPVLSAIIGIPVVDALDAAICRLEAVVSGLREIMNVPECSAKAALALYAAESALALVGGSHAGVDAIERSASQSADLSNREADVEGSV